MCRVLRVSRSSYYQWIKNPFSKRELRSLELDRYIRSAYDQSKGRYGSPRLAKELQQSSIKVSTKTVAKHMRMMGLKSKLSRKYKPATDSWHKEPVAVNILNRDFESLTPEAKCVSDITYLPTQDGFLYLTTVIDLFNRDVAGWSISQTMTAQQTVIDAINKAANNCKFKEGMIFHSDRGVQYASKATVNTLKHYAICQSMSRKGNCWDNAVAESFFKSLKAELIYGRKLISKEQMKIQVCEYIEIWYRKKRRYSYLNYLTIPEFESKFNEKSQKNNHAA